MLKSLVLFICLSAVSLPSSGQDPVSANTDSTVMNTGAEASAAKAPKSSEPFILKPIIGLGTGMFSFYGDLYEKNFMNPQVSRIGYDLSVSQKLTPFLNMGFYVLFGKLGANERQIVRNLNFESQIRVGGIHLEYNFDNFLKKDRIVSPYISAGFESFEFLSKTDLYDKYGNKYHYWSDGSIRNLDESSLVSGNAIIIQRDYSYESDIREMNLDGFGKYAERSWAIPVGAGALMHLSPRVDFKIGATMHFTLTDYVDGVTENSIGNRKGNGRNDNFVMTSFSVRYDLIGERDSEKIKEEDFDDSGIYAIDTDDLDKDGVLDINDSCQFTPAGVPVDLKGCPLDSDMDLVSDYKDKQVPSPNPLTNEDGITLTDSMMQRTYDFYNDTLGTKFMIVEVVPPAGRPKTSDQREYTVLIGSYKGGLSNDLMTKFLSISDINSTTLPDSSTAYTAGTFYNILDAEKRKRELQSQGMTDAKVVYKKGNMFLDPETSFASGKDTGKDVVDGGKDTGKDVVDGGKDTGKDVIDGGKDVSPDGPGKVVFRVQLGAYRKKLSKSVFPDVPNLVELKTEDGLYKYTSGSFNSFDEAARHKVELLQKYPGAFIVAYKDGKRVALTEAGATPAPKMPKENLEEQTAPESTINKDLIVFKIQVGAFKNEPPEEIKAKFDQLTGLERSLTSTGLSRFTVGNFKNYNDAVASRDKIRAQGIEDAFIIAFFKDELINVQEAIELKK